MTLNSDVIRKVLFDCFDDLSEALVFVEKRHQRVHVGKAFSCSHLSSSVANGTNLDVLMKTGAYTVHLVYTAAVSAEFEIRLYEDTIISSDGTFLPVLNKNRGSVNTTTLLAFLGPTVTGIGTELRVNLLPGAQKDKEVGAILGEFPEYNLKPDTNYLIRLSNTSGGTSKVAMDIEFYLGLPI